MTLALTEPRVAASDKDADTNLSPAAGSAQVANIAMARAIAPAWLMASPKGLQHIGLIPSSSRMSAPAKANT